MQGGTKLSLPWATPVVQDSPRDQPPCRGERSPSLPRWRRSRAWVSAGVHDRSVRDAKANACPVNRHRHTGVAVGGVVMAGGSLLARAEEATAAGGADITASMDGSGSRPPVRLPDLPGPPPRTRPRRRGGGPLTFCHSDRLLGDPHAEHR